MKVFDLKGNNTNFVAEILAGIMSFVTMSYLLKPCSEMVAGDTVTESTVYIGFCIACFLGCVIMGLWSKQPLVVGPSVGLTAYFSSMLMTDLQYNYTEALAIAFFAGLIFLALTFTGVGDSLFYSVSGSMKNGISAGLGLYIAMIGLKNSGFLSGGADGIWKIADLALLSETFFTVMVMFAGIVAIGIFKRVNFPFPPLLGLLMSAILYYGVGILLGFVTRSDLKPNLGGFNDGFGTWYGEGFLRNLTSGIGGIVSNLSIGAKTILTLVITVLVCSIFNMTDSVGVIYAIAKNHGKFDENGKFGAFRNTLASSAASSAVGTLFGCPMVSVAPESIAGICAQGKSSLTSVTAGVLFLLAAFFTPVAAYIPSVVTACVMVYIGFTMLGAVKEIDCSDIGEGVPALLTIILIPLTSSIIDGIALGFLFHVIVNIFIFKFKSIKPIEVVIALLFGLHYFYL